MQCQSYAIGTPQSGASLLVAEDEEEEGSHRSAIAWPGKNLLKNFNIHQTPSEEKIARGTNLSSSSPPTALQAIITPQNIKGTEKNQIAGQRR